MHTTVRAVPQAKLIGVTAAHAIAALLSSLEQVEEIYVAECKPLPALQKRFEFSESERIVFERALDDRRRRGVSFWDAALLELSGEPAAMRFLDEALRHVTFRGCERALSRKFVISGGLERLCNEYGPDSKSSLTVLSEVRCSDGSSRHIPMLDFHAFSAVPNQQALVAAVVQRLFPQRAIILESGESYHAYGTKLVSEARFRRFLGEALLCAPIVDRVYLAHQWIEGRCALRLSPGGGKFRTPSVIAVVTGN